MKQLTIILFMCFSMGSVLMAQPGKINGAVVTYTSSQKPGEAAVKLQAALSDTTLFYPKKEKALYKGYYYYAVCLAKMVSSDTVNVKKFDQPAIDAHKYYQKVMTSEQYATKYKRLAETDQAEYSIWSALYNLGLKYFNSEQYGKSAAHYKLAAVYKPDHILTNRMLGASSMMVKDTASATQALETALSSYQKQYEGLTEAQIQEKTKSMILSGVDFRAQKSVDSSQLSYIVQQLAVLYDVKGEPKKALNTLSDGLKLSPGDEDMKRQELNIYNRNPELFEESKAKFEAAIEKNPEDLPIKLAYAAMLERNGELDRAFELFEDAYKRNPEDLQANYRLAAYYVNKAADLSAKKSDYTKMEDIDKADAEIKGYAGKAYPFLVWLHNKQPNEAEWLKRLVEISGIIGKDDEMLEYGKKLGELKN
ncbi:MAG: tetratricopeptide repeat protein [Bacteroidia bacterium]|nr:tetratricopeptide repeat protein [Bacteroidia bacterium]